ncbi:MAG: DUF294 nucleotidyltransferase-like domain-containing protein [Rhodocyclaceae bacterium]|nr:DUF294 nucleotidyltransferase-like domain-containing protein [Rhodocyclaceae bacterium]
MTQMLLDAAIAFLSRHAPFDEMAEQEPQSLRFLAERLKQAYFEPECRILGPEVGVPGHFFIIQRGRVQARQAGEASVLEADAMTLGEGECFPIGAVTAQRPSTNRYTAIGDVFCLQLPAADFQALLKSSAIFHRFCTRYIASLLMQSRRQIQVQFAQRASEQRKLSAPLSELVRRTPVSVPESQALRLALQIMSDQRVGSIVVCDTEDRPTGIFTQSDLLQRVVLAGIALETPVSAVMSREPHTLPLDASAFDAASLMARHGIRHVLAVDAQGRLAGVLSERDLFASQRLGLHQVRQAIQTAPDVPRLQAAAADVRRLARELVAQGIGAEAVTRFITALNDALTRRVIEMNLERHDLSGADWAWLAFGSEGREEQTLATDQDNGIVFLAREFSDREELRLRLTAFGADVNRDLDACGFRLCPGLIMAGRPECCLSLEEWQERFLSWMRTPDPVALLNASIYFDFRPVFGAEKLARLLKKSVFDTGGRAPQFLFMLAQNALAAYPPLGRLQDFVVDADPADPGPRPSLDLKKAGARIFTDCARVYAIARGLAPTNTAQRLHALAQLGEVDAADMAAVSAGFHFIQSLRLRLQSRDGEGTGGNRMVPDSLHEMDRRLLKESLRQVRKLQQRLRADFLS